jgi:hypothetical protein
MRPVDLALALLSCALAACSAGSSGEGFAPARGASGTSAAGAGGAAASSGEAGSGGLDASTEGAAAAAGSPNPCAGVTCNKPPPNACADAKNLKVHSPAGTCDKGACLYASSLVACTNGCVSSQCSGDPCVGVTCASPPKSYCSDPSHLVVYEPPGTCDLGICSYGSHQQFCHYGCESDVCNGDPCLGKTCTSPPANYCTDADHLTVHETPGTCQQGSCSYARHDEYCNFGCEKGACSGNPCAGVTCSTPPASFCVGTSAMRTFAATGTCAAGVCSYAPTDIACPHGCEAGKCKDCKLDTDCGSGKWCKAQTCAPCDDDLHCGPSCADCAAGSKVCNGAGACVQCTVNGHCGPGAWCNASSCAPCDTAQHCGATCAACSGQTPSCGGGACVCTGSSCPAAHRCTGGACALCNADSACGAGCPACVSPTPRCLDQGTSSVCVECVQNGDCTGGKTCTAGHICADASCGVYQGKTLFACAPDGMGRGKCPAGQLVFESCPNGCLVKPTGQDDVCMGTTTSWSCSGSYGTAKAENGDYYATCFGCWKDQNGGIHTDPGDNCIPACLDKAKSSGLCAGMSGPDCEESVNWYTADGARFGCLARMRVTYPKNGKKIVVTALDYGPSCSVEQSVSHAVLDLSGRACQYLFGGEVGPSEKVLVHVVEVAATTPLGPI